MWAPCPAGQAEHHQGCEPRMGGVPKPRTWKDIEWFQGSAFDIPEGHGEQPCLPHDSGFGRGTPTRASPRGPPLLDPAPWRRFRSEDTPAVRAWHAAGSPPTPSTVSLRFYAARSSARVQAIVERRIRDSVARGELDKL